MHACFVQTLTDLKIEGEMESRLRNSSCHKVEQATSRNIHLLTAGERMSIL